jgi:hypothetical protein
VAFFKIPEPGNLSTDARIPSCSQTDCNKYKMDLTTNGVVITDAIKFVQTNKEKLMSKEDDKESKEPDYEEDKDQLEEKQEEETWLVVG